MSIFGGDSHQKRNVRLTYTNGLTKDLTTSEALGSWNQRSQIEEKLFNKKSHHPEEAFRSSTFIFLGKNGCFSL